MAEQHENTPESQTTSIGQAQAMSDHEVVKSPDFKIVYVNNLSFSGSAFDMHLTFGELYRDVFGKNILEQRVMISLSPQMAKALAATLSGAINNYEAQLGEIKLPPITARSDEPSA